MSDTVLKVTHSLSSDSMMISCDLSQASAPVSVSFDRGEEWQTTQWQCADCRHYPGNLAEIGMKMLHEGSTDEFDADDYEWVCVEKKSWIELEDSNNCEKFQSVEDAAEAALSWYDYIGENPAEYAGSDDWEMPQVKHFTGSKIQHLKEWIRQFNKAVAESIGKKDFEGHGGYCVSAAAAAGFNLRADWVEADEWTEIED